VPILNVLISHALVKEASLCDGLDVYRVEKFEDQSYAGRDG